MADFNDRIDNALEPVKVPLRRFFGNKKIGELIRVVVLPFAIFIISIISVGVFFRYGATAAGDTYRELRGWFKKKD